MSHKSSEDPKPPPKPALHFASSDLPHIAPYLPSAVVATSSVKPFVTITFATSLDSSLSLAPGTQTALSGPETKAMTHYLRSQHEAILVGVGTAVADNPALNCRIEGVGLEEQPRPVIVDPSGRWLVEEDGKLAECVRLAEHGIGKGPWVLTTLQEDEINHDSRRTLERCGGQYICFPCVPKGSQNQLQWRDIIDTLGRLGVKSAMIEGGGTVINTLLEDRNLNLIDSVIITIAPVWLGEGGVLINPPRRTDEKAQPIPVARLDQVKWKQFGDDVVLCGKIKR
jgi:2,5-diamino-6-(ribosylamino)-4(3H)-pyrimidinone 5'-phosphate reductase